MEDEPFSPCLARAAGAAAKLAVLAGLLPLLPALISGRPLAAVIALISSTLVIEYGAGAVGIGLGLPPPYVLFVLLCIALGVTVFLFDLFDLAGEQSRRVGAFLAWSRRRAAASRLLSRYGMYGLVPLVITLGFYVCPPVAWVLGWDRRRSVLLIMTGYAIASVATVLVTMGVLDLVAVFSGVSG
jgi:uncharacterized membrane protein